MRIISGRFKGRRINPPLKKWRTRPTMDIAREGLFNVLSNQVDFEHTRVLELFGGTGIISLEFISRGCTDVHLVEIYRPAVNFIKNLAISFEIESNINLIKSDALKYVKDSEEKFDLIFLDPPYQYKHYTKIINTIFDRQMLNSNGLLIVEHDNSQDFNNIPALYDIRKYGDSFFSFFR